VVNTPCSVFNALYVLGLSLEDDDEAIALEVGGAFGILLMRRGRYLNIHKNYDGR